MAAASTPGQATRMRAVVQSSYGTADVLSTAEVDRPVPGSGEVLVQVRAAGLDRGAWHLMAGKPYAARLAVGLRTPKHPVPGRELAGVVVALGSDVTRFAVGDEVYGVGLGSFAEYAVARQDKLVMKPAALSFEQAAALPVSGLTALQGLTDVGRLEAGQRVLVIGASGGVGSLAVQIAKALGAHVTGVCSTGNVDLVRSLGADEVLDYTRDDVTAGQRPYDLILDMAGDSAPSRLRRLLTPRGTLVIGGGEHGGPWLGMGRQLRALALSPFVRQRLTIFVAKENVAGLERLTALADDGRLVPAVAATYSLVDVPQAVRQLESGHPRGKLVITP